MPISRGSHFCGATGRITYRGIVGGVAQSELTERLVRCCIWESVAQVCGSPHPWVAFRTAASRSSGDASSLRPDPLDPSDPERNPCLCQEALSSSSLSFPRNTPRLQVQDPKCICFSCGVRRSPAGCAILFSGVMPYIFLRAGFF